MIHEAQLEEERIVQEMVTQWSSGGHGYVPAEKPEEVVRLAAENANSLSIYHRENWKIRKLFALNNKYQTDGMLMVRSDVNRSQTRDGKKCQELFPGGACCRVSAGHNVHELGACFPRYQHDSTLSAAFSRLSMFVLETLLDPSGLGRWLCIYDGTEERKTRIVSAYQPCRSTEDKSACRLVNGKHRSRMTVWAQHCRYFRK